MKRSTEKWLWIIGIVVVFGLVTAFGVWDGIESRTKAGQARVNADFVNVFTPWVLGLFAAGIVGSMVMSVVLAVHDHRKEKQGLAQAATALALVHAQEQGEPVETSTEDELEDLIKQLEDCAVTGTPGYATYKRKKVRQLVGKIIELVESDEWDGME